MGKFEEYKLAEDKVKFFKSLRNYEKTDLWDDIYIETRNGNKELWDMLNDKERKSLFSVLSIDRIKELMTMISKKEQREALKYFDSLKMRAYYKKLTEKEKKEFATLLDKESLALLVAKDKLNEKVSSANQSLSNSVSNIAKSNKAILDAKEERKATKQEIKENKTSLKIAKINEKIKYIKMLRASRPSKLDRIGFISKIRSNRLSRLTDEYLEANKERIGYEENDQKLRDKVSSLEMEIEKEEKNIRANNENIRKQTDKIAQANKDLKQVEAKIVKLDRSERVALGSKLHNQKADARSKAFVTKKLKKAELASKKQKEAESVKKEEPQVVKEAVAEGVKAVQSLAQSGVQFNYPAVVPQTVINAGSLADKDVVANLTVEQVSAMAVVLFAWVQKQQQIQMEQKKKEEQEKTNGVTKTLTKSPGNVSLGFLAGIIAFLLMVMFLFF